MFYAFLWLASRENDTQNNFLIHHLSRLAYIFYKMRMNIQVCTDTGVNLDTDTS